MTKDQELTILKAELWQVKRLAFGHKLGDGAVLSPLGVRVQGLVHISSAVAQLSAPLGELPESTNARVRQLSEEIQQAILARVATNVTH